MTIEGPVTVIKHPSAQEQAEQARKQEKDIWDKAIEALLLTPSQWPNIGLLLLASLAAGFTFCAYLATRRQAIAAEKTYALAITPRLFIDGVRAVNFEVGREPSFFVKIVNASPAIAEQVAVIIRVEPTAQYGGAKYSDGAHLFTIPANGHREEFIRVSRQLTDELITGLNQQAWQLRVTGSYEYAGKRTEYCYKYNPFTDPGAGGLPQFIPCDFDTRRTIIMMVGNPPLPPITASQGNMTPFGGTPVG